MSDRLSDEQLDEHLSHLPGWARADNAIEKQYTVGSFPDAVALVTRLAFDAEAADHHPDLLIEYRRLTVRYWTHTAGGVTAKDIEGAAMTERLAQPFVVAEK
jgi:4a-hydroxytetrahydrobiopterin dehydratase